MSEQELLRKRVYEFRDAHQEKGKLFTVKHFQDEFVPKATIYRILQRKENGLPYQQVSGQGPKANKMPKKKVKRLQGMFDHHDSISQSQAASKFNVTQQYISQILAKKTAIKARKKIKIPKRTEQQRAIARTKCGRLYQMFLRRKCIMDDESYFTLQHTSINGNGRFYTSDISKTPPSVKYKQVDKFPKKLLVWFCFSEEGMSPPFFVPSGLAINQYIYLDECIKKRLIPFIEKHHSDGQYVFWPNLASAHYAKTVIAYLREKKVNFVEKEDNPANVPEARPIENFWGVLKGLVYKNNWQAENLDQLKQRIQYCWRQINPDFIQSLAAGVRRQVDLIRRNDLVENK